MKRTTAMLLQKSRKLENIDNFFETADDQQSLLSEIARYIDYRQSLALIAIEIDVTIESGTLNLFRHKVKQLFFRNQVTLQPQLLVMYPYFAEVQTLIQPDMELLAIHNGLLDKLSDKNQTDAYLTIVLLFIIDMLNGKASSGLQSSIRRYLGLTVKVSDFYQLLYHVIKLDKSDFIRNLMKTGLFQVDNYSRLSRYSKNKFQHLLLHFYEVYKRPNEFLGFYSGLKTLLNYEMANRNIDNCLRLRDLIRRIYSNLNNNLQSWQHFDAAIEKPLSQFFFNEAKTSAGSAFEICETATGKIRLGYAVRKICLTPMMKMILSVFKGHLLSKSSRFELTIYSYDCCEKEEDDLRLIESVRHMGGRCVTVADLGCFEDEIGYSHYEKAQALQQQIVADKIDVFITCAGGIANYLVSTRVAAVQLHWSQTDPFWSVNNLDGRIRGESVNQLEKRLFENIEYYCFPEPMSEELLNPPADPAAIAYFREEFPADSIVLGFIGLLHRVVNEQYIQMLVKIMRLRPKTVMLFCGQGNYQRLAACLRFQGLQSRVFYTDASESHLCGHVIDLFLDSFPEPAETAKINEFGAKGKAVVSLETGSESFGNMRMADCHSVSEQEYIELVLRLIDDAEYRTKLGWQYRQFVLEKLDCAGSARVLENLYTDLLNKKIQQSRLITS